MIYRRALLLLLVAICLYNLYGCSSAGEICNIRDDYAGANLDRTGRVTLAWKFGQGFTDSRYGETFCELDPKGERACVVLLSSPPPSINNVCALARLGHEVGHAMGVPKEH